MTLYRPTFNQCAIIYILVSLMTFGYCAAYTHVDEGLRFTKDDKRASVAIMAAIFWPAYWSWVAFENGKQVKS